MRSTLSLCVVALCIALAPAWAQRVKLKRANSLRSGSLHGERFDRVLGNVLFTQRTVAIYCDSAHFFRAKNTIEAFGRIRIHEGDSIRITASALSYDGNSATAHLRENIVFKKRGSIALYTDFLDYDKKGQEARYYHGGKLLDKGDTLYSEKGYYDLQTGMASFKKKVVGRSGKYTLKADTLQYDTRSRMIFFRDTSTIINPEGDKMVYQSGSYSTEKKVFKLQKGTTRTASYTLGGDDYTLDDSVKVYTLRGNVRLTLIEDSLTLYGQRGYYNQKSGRAKVYDEAYISKTDGSGDTLFMRADTLVAIEKKNVQAQLPPPEKRAADSTDAQPDGDAPLPKDAIDNVASQRKDSIERIVLAYNNVKIFKSDLQGVADSLAFSTRDSTVRFFNEPVLWSAESQMTADSIHMVISQGTIDRIYLIDKPFVASRDTLNNFNQMKGLKMTAYFKDQAISYVDVEGNGETLYFAVDEKDGQLVLIGVNHVLCSNMKIRFKNKEVDDISFYVRPEADFKPPFLVGEKERTLEGFNWRGEEKPLKEHVVGRLIKSGQ